jgi:hypothetical protein
LEVGTVSLRSSSRRVDCSRYVHYRPLVLRLSKEEEHRSKRPQQRSERSTRKRKRSSSSSASGQDILVVAGPSNSRTGPGVSKVPCGITNSPPEVVEIESDDDALEVPTSDPEEESTGMYVRCTTPNFPRLSSTAGNDIVDCPLCSRRVELRTINKHMDQGCRPGSEVTKVTDRRSNTKNIWSTILGTGAKGKERWQPRATRGGSIFDLYVFAEKSFQI